jgi:endonuclease YncB( thermonuclease family)
MFLHARLLSGNSFGAGAIAALAFAAGIALGLSLGPLTGRSLEATASPAPPPALVPHEPIVLRASHPAEVLRVIDGDTFEARVNLWPGLAITTRVRLRGIDAPELRAHCAEEFSKADAARQALKVLLDQGEVGISHVTLDKYGGRVVANASTAATPDVSSALLSAGHARRYDGGRRQPWCGIAAN